MPSNNAQPRPWRYDTIGGALHILQGADKAVICELKPTGSCVDQAANVALICKAVNAYADDTLDLLQESYHRLAGPAGANINPSNAAFLARLRGAIARMES